MGCDRKCERSLTKRVTGNWRQVKSDEKTKRSNCSFDRQTIDATRMAKRKIDQVWTSSLPRVSRRWPSSEKKQKKKQREGEREKRKNFRFSLNWAGQSIHYDYRWWLITTNYKRSWQKQKKKSQRLIGNEMGIGSAIGTGGERADVQRNTFAVICSG